MAELFEGLQVLLEGLIAWEVGFAWLGRPKPQGVGDPVAVSWDGDVIWDGADAGGVDGAEAIFAVWLKIGLGVAIELDFDGMLWLPDFEDEAVGEPLVWQFHLLAMDEFLAEEAVFVTDGVAVSRIA